MSVGDLASVIIAATAFIGLLIAGVAWFYKRGGQEAEYSVALRANTAAVSSLTSRFDKFIERTMDKQEELDKRVDTHETRISLNERNISVNARDISDLQRREIIRHPLRSEQ